MSDRREQFGTSIPSPVNRYYTWGSEKKSFKYYDKVEGADKLVFPLNFVFLTSRATVRGWNDETSSSIYANLVKNSGKEILTVKSSKPNKNGNTLLASGIYKDIKANLGGGHFEKVVFGFEEGVGIIQINIKGSGLSAYSEFEKANKNLFDNYVSISTFQELKKGATKYSVPNFVLGEKVAVEVDKLANDAYKELDAYFIAKSKTSIGEKDEYQSEEYVEEVMSVVESDGLPF